MQLRAANQRSAGAKGDDGWRAVKVWPESARKSLLGAPVSQIVGRVSSDESRTVRADSERATPPYARLIRYMLPVAAVLALLRYEVHAFRTLQVSTRTLQESGEMMTIISPDVALRDVPRAQKLLHGGWFEDAHYEGEITWYPSVRPALAALTAKVMRVNLTRAYYTSDLILVGFGLVAAFVLAWAALRRAGAITLSAAICAGLMPDLDEACLYPGQSVRALLFCFTACCTYMFGRQSERRGLSFGWYALLGAMQGLIGLWHGASFVVASCMSLFLLVHGLWLSLRLPQTRVRALVRCAVLGGACSPFMALLILPQWLHYGHFSQPQSARLWLETTYEGGHSLASALHLELFPRDASALCLVLFALALIHPSTKGRLWPMAFAIIVCTVLGHMGFLVNDTEHPALQKIARTLLLAPPHTLWGVGCLLMMFARVFGVAWACAFLLRRLTGLGDAPHARRAAAEQLAWLASLLCVAIRPLPAPDLPGRPAPLALRRFAREIERQLAGKTVELDGRIDLAGQANLYPLWVRYRDHTNHYVQAQRREDVASLGRAIEQEDFATAQAILDRYDVGGFVTDAREPSALAARCGDGVIVSSPIGLQLVAYRGQCRAGQP